MFQTAEAGGTGSDRNLIRVHGFFQVDLGIFKNIAINKTRLEIRTEIFNLFNTVNFSDPSSLVTAGSFGTITDTRVPPRIVQFGVKYYF